jgi:hypothetical protein
MNRARIALFLHLDRVTWEKGRWSSCWNPFPKPSIGQFGELRFRDYSDLSGSLLVARCNGEIIEEEAVLRSGQFSWGRSGPAGSHPEFDSDNHPELQFDENTGRNFVAGCLGFEPGARGSLSVDGRTRWLVLSSRPVSR